MDNNLKELIQAVIDGPCNHTAYYILKRLQIGDIQGARNEFERDGDKVSCSIYQKPIIAILGCRLHGTKNCGKPFCKQRD